MKMKVFAFLFLSACFLTSCSNDDGKITGEKDVNNLLLKDFRPQSIYNIPRTEVKKAKFPIIDMHSHAYAESPEMVDQWVKTMDEVGIEKTIILSNSIGAVFDSIYTAYAGRYPKRFEVWCGIDFSGYDKPGFGPEAVAELERCYKVGATGVGELSDKGMGLSFFGWIKKANGLHPDDPRMDPLWEKCAELNMPVNIHVADPIWMYQPMDSTNDGLMNAVEWRLDNHPDIVDNPGMLKVLENTVKKHPNTTFIACHFANQSYDLAKLGNILDVYPNLYADISARYAETAPIPRYMKIFYKKYQDRLLYGTDMGLNKYMYKITFSVLETMDEHFYEIDHFGYHWAMNGFGLSEKVLKKLYQTNALKIIK